MIDELRLAEEILDRTVTGGLTGIREKNSHVRPFAH